MEERKRKEKGERKKGNVWTGGQREGGELTPIKKWLKNWNGNEELF
jgi:hypothetical protein